MDTLNYFAIIIKLMPPDQLCLQHYLPHVTLVTKKALDAADKLGLSQNSHRYIEEASMLHDIGIIAVDAPGIGCHGKLPYLMHGIEGRHMLEEMGLPRHALVAERHLGLGISKQEIIDNSFPLPHRDMLPTCVEERIICWADLFFTKSKEKLWREYSEEEVRQHVARYGERSVAAFETWNREFNGK